VKLSMDEAVRLALENNPDVTIARAEPEIGLSRVAQAKGAFVPVATGTLGRTGAEQPPSNFLLGTGVLTNEFFGSAGARQRLPLFGGTWSASWDAARTTSNSILTNYNPALNAGLQAAFSQPLLRDLAIDAARLQLTVAKRNREMSDIRFREIVAQTVADVKRAYWDLVAGLANVQVQQRSLELAQELERINRARVDVGQAPPLDLISAQAEVAQRREQVISAQQLAKDLEDRLRVLIVRPSQPDAWTLTIDPTDRPVIGQPLPDLDAAVASMLRERGDLLRARIETENAATAVRYYQNQRLPDLRLEASYRAAGLGGDRLIREGGFPGTVVGVVPGSFGATMDQVWARDYPAWTLGVTVSYPIGTSYEEASLTRARLEQQQSVARAESLELRAIREVRQAGRNIGAAQERIEATRAARELALQRLATEQKRFEVGMSTSFLVVQAQRDLAQAEITELRAQLDYQAALINFDTLQQAPLVGGQVLIAGSAVAPVLPPQPRGLSRTTAGSIGF
jgi:outer membrane protein TolC